MASKHLSKRKPAAASDEKLVDEAKAAKILGVTIPVMRRLMKERGVKPIKVPGVEFYLGVAHLCNCKAETRDFVEWEHKFHDGQWLVSEQCCQPKNCPACKREMEQLLVWAWWCPACKGNNAAAPRFDKATDAAVLPGIVQRCHHCKQAVSPHSVGEKEGWAIRK